jgi:hypothetical protein
MASVIIIVLWFVANGDAPGLLGGNGCFQRVIPTVVDIRIQSWPEKLSHL